jgi:WD40 repeat protein
MLLAQRAWDESNLGLALDLQNKHRPVPGTKDFRDWEWRYLWRLCQSDELFTLDPQPGIVSVAFSPDGSRVATASWWENPNEGEVRIWDFNERRLIATPNHQDALGSVAFSADGGLLAFGTFNHGVTVWSIALGQEVASFPVRQRPRVGCGLSFSPEEHMLAIGDNEGAVTVWDTEAKVRRLTLSGHRAAVSSVVFLPDAKTLASASRDGSVRLWNLATGQSIAEFQHSDGVQSVAVSKDGKTLVSGGWQNTIHVWDIGSRTQLFVLTNHTAWVSSLAFSPDGKSLVSASADHTLRLWDAATWQEIDTLRGHHDEVSGVIFSPDGKWLLSGAKNGEVKIWNPVRERREVNFLKWPDDLRGYTVASDGSAVGVLHHDGNISLWELPSLRQTARCLLPDSQANLILFDLAPRGKRIAYITRDGWLKVWDCEIGQELRRIQHNWARTFVFEFSSTGRILVSGGESPFMTLWDAEALKPIAMLPRSQKNPVRQIAFSRDEQLLAAGTSDGAIEVWNIPRKEQLVLARHRGLAGLALMPDNQSLATVGTDATARIWDLSTRSQKVTLGKTLNAFNCIVAAPNGLRLATGANTDYISLWDPSTGLEIARLRGHHKPVVALLFLPDGNTLVSAAGDGLRLWRAPSWLEIEAAEKAAGDYSH